MVLPSKMQGRDFGPTQLHEIQTLLREHPEWSRYQLSRQLALRWNWRSPNGQLKDMAARTLLLKLAQRAWIELPALVRASPTRSGRSPAPVLGTDWDSSPLCATLSGLGPLQIEEVSGRTCAASRAQLEDCLHRHHYLGYQARVGENLQYWVRRAADRRPLACVVFGAPAWQCAPRDRWIGWSSEQRSSALGGIANNTRFLILPWVQVPQLASHILGAISRRIAGDWAAKYHHPIHLLETFVERSRFRGTAYRAANWPCVGLTQGRGRQGPSDLLSTSIKDIYLYGLHPGWRQSLFTPTPNSRPATNAGGDSRAVPAVDE